MNSLIKNTSCDVNSLLLFTILITGGLRIAACVGTIRMTSASSFYFRFTYRMYATSMKFGEYLARIYGIQDLYDSGAVYYYSGKVSVGFS